MTLDGPAYTPGRFVSGRDFTPAEVRQSRPLVILSVPLAQELFGELDPIGRKIRVSAGNRGVSEAFRVVGVFQTEDNIFAAAIKHWAILPYKLGDEEAEGLQLAGGGVGRTP